MKIKLSRSSGDIPDGHRISRKNFGFTGRIFIPAYLKIAMRPNGNPRKGYPSVTAFRQRVGRHSSNQYKLIISKSKCLI